MRAIVVAKVMVIVVKDDGDGDAYGDRRGNNGDSGIGDSLRWR